MTNTTEKAYLTIVANIIAKADSIELVKAELLKLLDTTRAEEGCVNYDLHQDNNNPAHFVFYENWLTEELLQAHLASPHITQYKSATEGATESFTINRMTKLA